MTHTYKIAGMTCSGCVAKVKSELLKIGDIASAEVQLASPQATITMQKHIPLPILQASLHRAGKYEISEDDSRAHHEVSADDSKSWLQTYKPVLLLLFYISVIAIIVASAAGGFDRMHGMRVFMSGFFLAFSFFKLLDLNAFADNYASYDIIAKRFHGWGYIYAFIELALGIAYAINFSPIITNTITLVVMSVSIIGVLQSVLNKRKIQCACLGAVFNLPMSSVTIIEDGLMIAMSGMMIVSTQL